MFRHDKDAVSVRFSNDQKNKLLIERVRIDRSINWIIRKAVERYFEGVENELNIIKIKIKK